jgi:hypothetical protein
LLFLPVLLLLWPPGPVGLRLRRRSWAFEPAGGRAGTPVSALLLLESPPPLLPLLLLLLLRLGLLPPTPLTAAR